MPKYKLICPCLATYPHKWAGEYDEAIPKLSDSYPFEGYYDVLNYVHNQIKVKNQIKILDIGIGTGLLTNELYKSGAQIYGIDFSKEMLDKARYKMPLANFYLHDFKFGLPSELDNIKFEFIVSSYAIHHLEDNEKINFIMLLKRYLKENGKIIIADISFETRKELEICKNDSSKKWDDEEIYIVADEFKYVATSDEEFEMNGQKLRFIYYIWIAIQKGVN